MVKNKKYTYGSVLILEREQNEDYWRDCCMKMCGLHMNTVVIWPPVFYVDGQRDYSVQKRFIQIAADNNLEVIVELSGQVFNLEYLPDSRYRDDYAVIDPDGKVARMQNGLGELNYNHPEVKREIKAFLSETIQALKDCSNLAGWDVWNETHFKSYDPHTFAVFQQWLNNKYEDIERLNSSWKKSYIDFSQIRHDPVTWASIVPDCDWEEFRTDNLAAICAEWVGWVKQYDAVHPVIADNVMSNAVWSEFDRGTDDWKVAASADRYGISFYPKTGGRLLPENAPWLRSLTFSGASSAGNGSFVISEMQSHYYSEIFTVERVTPTDIIVWNIEALEHGCAGSIYWKWAPFKTGFQLGGRGLVLADGSLSKRAEAARKIGALVEEYPELGLTKPYSKAAVLYDSKNNYSIKAVNNRVKHIIGNDQPLIARYGLYKLCWERNIPVRIITAKNLERLIDSYKVLFMPYQVVLSDEACTHIRKFVEEGGVLVANYPFGSINANGRLFESIPGGPLHDLIGANHLDNVAIGKIEIQQLELVSEATVIKDIDGCPLMFSREIGQGRVIYAATSIWNNAYAGNCNDAEILLDMLMADCPQLCPLKSDVHAAITQFENTNYLFVNNYKEHSECFIKLNCNCHELTHIFGTAEILINENNLVLKYATQEIFRLE